VWRRASRPRMASDPRARLGRGRHPRSRAYCR
jgi:hypothetical protein